jgi:C4-dicarboxylate transporter DctM subunit
MKWLDEISSNLNKFGGALSGAAILILGIIISYEVIMRYIFRSPTIWVADISLLLCIGSVFFAVGYAMKEKAHIAVDLITGRLSYHNQVLFSLIGLIISAVYCSFLTWKGAEVAIATLRTGEMSAFGFRYPMAIPRAFIPIGGILLLLELINQTVTGIFQFINIKEREEAKNETWLTKNLPPLVFLALLTIGGAMCLSKGLAPLGLTFLLFVLIFGGTPIAFALGLLGLIGFQYTLGGGQLLNHIPMVSFNILTDFIIVAIPLFIMVSSILGIGGVGANLFELANKFVGRLPGGMGVATILACAVFAAISGSATATVLAIGIIAIPAMISAGYERKVVYGTVAMGGVLGPLIPPSLFMILIGSITGDSVGKLFMAGMLPGIMLAFFFSIYIILYSMKNKSSMSKMNAVPWRERWGSLRKSFFGLLTPVIILGGIYAGIFTPTEAAAVGVTYGLFICIFIYRSLSLKKLWQVIFDTAKLNALILFLVAGAMVFGQVVALLKIPDTVCAFLSRLPFSPMTILLLVLIFILVLGSLMDEASILLITYPILYQIFVKHFGFDSIWFAMVFVFTLEVGLVAPPVGINLFIVQGIDKTAKFEEIVKGVLPFVIIMIAGILIVVYFKPLSTWLPKLIG